MSEKAKWTPGKWHCDTIRGETDEFKYDSFAVCDDDGRVIVDALNSSVSCIETEGPDEEGFVDRWDEQGRLNCLMIAAAPAMAEALEPFKRALAWFESRMTPAELMLLDDKTHMIGCEITVADLKRAVEALALAHGESK